MKKKIFFDLDGTLTDSGKGIMNGIKYAQEKLCLPELSPEKLRSCVGPPMPNYFTKVWNINIEKATEVLTTYREYYIPKGIYENEVYDGVPELLQNLTSANIECCVCSAKPEVMVRTVLDYFKITDYFTKINGAGMHGNYKGKGAVLKELLAEEECIALMVGDRENDIFGGHEAGLKTIGALWGYGEKNELQNAKTDFSAEKPSDIFYIATNYFNGK